MKALALVLAIAAAQAGQPVLRQSEIDTLPTAVLASHLLPTNLAPEAVTHEVLGYRAGYPSVFFTLKAQPFGDQVCRHRFVEASMQPNASDAETLVRERLRRYSQYALDAGCRRNRPDLSVSPAGNPGDLETIEVMLRFASILDEMRAGEAPEVGVRCTSSIPSTVDVCARGGAAVFAALDQADLLHARWINGIWYLSVMPQGRGRAYWEVRLPQAPDDRRILGVEWKYPAPF